MECTVLMKNTGARKSRDAVLIKQIGHHDSENVCIEFLTELYICMRYRYIYFGKMHLENSRNRRKNNKERKKNREGGGRETPPTLHITDNYTSNKYVLCLF